MTGTDEFVHRLNQGSRFRVQPANDAGAYRLLPPAENASGHVEGYFDHQNLSLTIRKLQARDEFSDEEFGHGRLVFLLHLSGTRRIELGTCHNQELSKPTLVVYFQPLGLTKRSAWVSGANELSLSVGVWPDRLSTLFGFYPSCLPRFSGQTEGSNAFLYSRPLPFSVMSAAEQLLNPSIHPLLSKSYISIKAQELLWLSMSSLLSDGAFLSRADLKVDRVEQIKTMVEADLRDPRSLHEIAAVFGVSHEELSEDVRSQTGLTYGQYIIKCKMNRAMMMLESGAIPLKQVAFETGYSHTSNFCTAFKRYFGNTPKDVRRQQ